ncbi:MAG: hypothetical protein E7592_00785 [Ruminococcaceae bacterium]|nr:hypothetical protein [Oscillospiraceae bacterium]
MPELKKNDQSETAKNLKKADSEKSLGGTQIDYIVGLRGVKAKDPTESEKTRKAKARKKLPLAVDIIITLLMLALIVGVIVGAYYLFRYFSTDYESVNIEYSFAISCEENAAEYQKVLNKELYFDIDGSTVYFGKIKSISVSEDNTLAVLTVEVTAIHKADAGYYLGENRVAVGSDYTLRIEDQKIDGTVVELTGGLRES